MNPTILWFENLIFAMAGLVFFFPAMREVLARRSWVAALPRRRTEERLPDGRGGGGGSQLARSWSGIGLSGGVIGIPLALLIVLCHKGVSACYAW